jgi:transposase-like protein
MSSKKGQKQKVKHQTRERRTFSEALKRRLVSDLERKITTIQNICELYSVSRTSIYRWMYKYSIHYKKGTVQVIQMKSESEKNKQLYSRIQELEAVLGRKQLEIDYNSKLIELASKELGYDLKKNYEPQLLNGSVIISKDTTTP